MVYYTKSEMLNILGDICLTLEDLIDYYPEVEELIAVMDNIEQAVSDDWGVRG